MDSASSPGKVSSPSAAASPSPSNKAKAKAIRAENPGVCQIDGCDRIVHSVALKALNWASAVLLLPISDDFDAGRKHHCRQCLRRVCTDHFVTSKKKSDRRCTECAAAAEPVEGVGGGGGPAAVSGAGAASAMGTGHVAV